jgi:hypothetical protein
MQLVDSPHRIIQLTLPLSMSVLALFAATKLNFLELADPPGHRHTCGCQAENWLAR